MSERWRKPVKIYKAEESSENADQIAGKWYRGLKWTLAAEDFQRVRSGYVCLQCLEPHEFPFPEHCSLCGYAIKERQSKEMDLEFAGFEHVGPQTNIEDELDILDDTHERSLWTPGGTILVPQGKEAL